MNRLLEVNIRIVSLPHFNTDAKTYAQIIGAHRMSSLDNPRPKFSKFALAYNDLIWMNEFDLGQAFNNGFEMTLILSVFQIN